jgi:hypothetical protein
MQTERVCRLEERCNLQEAQIKKLLAETDQLKRGCAGDRRFVQCLFRRMRKRMRGLREEMESLKAQIDGKKDAPKTKLPTIPEDVE